MILGKGRMKFGIGRLGIPQYSIIASVHSVYRTKLILQVLPTATLYYYFVSEIFRTKYLIHHYLNVVIGMPIQVNENRSERRDQPADPTQAFLHYLKVLAFFQHIFKGKVAVVFNAM